MYNKKAFKTAFKFVFSAILAILIPINFYFIDKDLSEGNFVSGRVLGVSEKAVVNKHLPPSKNVVTSPIELKKEYLRIGDGLPPTAMARASAVFDSRGEHPFYEIDSDRPFPIASVTKLMTALVFLDRNIDLNNEHIISSNDRVAGGKIFLYNGDRVRLIDLLNLSLVASANTATNALVNSTGLSKDNFVGLMNKKAKGMGLAKTHFEDPIGLSARNLASVKEVAALASSAFSNKILAGIVGKKGYSFTTLNGSKKNAKTTNQLLLNYDTAPVEIIGGKTGFNNSAKYNFVGKFKKGKNEVIAVVLGADTKEARFDEALGLANWVFGNYRWE